MRRSGGRPGPGSLRVGRFIGRLGIVSLPAVEVGLALDERVVRRHVAKLEAAGWGGRAPWAWGEGSVAWLTGEGLRATGLGGLQPVRVPPAPTTIAHGVMVGWSAARAERRERRWMSGRELALDPARWAVRIRDEGRPSRDQLPDLAIWLPDSELPVALIVETGQRRADRQRIILKGWRDAIQAGRYVGVRYDCASASVAHRITHLAGKVWLAGPEFVAAVQPTGTQIAAWATAAPGCAKRLSDEPPSTAVIAARTGEQVDAAGRPPQARPVSESVRRVEPPPAPVPESAEAGAEREQRYREIFGIPEPGPRRRWRR